MTEAPRGRRWPWALVLGLAAGGAAACFYYGNRADTPAPPSKGDRLEAQVQQFCGGCHRVPPPDVLPRDRWKASVEQMYDFFATAGKALQPPPLDAAVKYYEDRAPAE